MDLLKEIFTPEHSCKTFQLDSHGTAPNLPRHILVNRQPRQALAWQVTLRRWREHLQGTAVWKKTKAEKQSSTAIFESFG